MFDVCLGLLPSTASSESTSAPPGREKRMAKRQKSKFNNSTRASDDELAALQSICKKNDILSNKTASELNSSVMTNLQNQRDCKRTLITEFASNLVGGKTEAKERIKNMKRSRESTDENDNGDFPSLSQISQYSTIMEIIECDDNITELENERKKTRALLKKASI